MASSNDINSTEKLLNTIRGKDSKSFPSIEKSPISLPPRRPVNIKKSSPSGFFSNKKHYTVGIDIGEDFLFMAKAVQSLDGSAKIVDQKSINYTSLTSKNSRDFQSFLKSQLTAFCGSVSDCNIWTTVMSHEVNVNHVRIPKVPAKQLENVIFWKAKKENPFNEKEVVFDFEIQDEIIDQGISQYLVMVYTVPKLEVDRVKTFYSEIGITLAGITIAPFAVQNIFRTKLIKASEETSASLFIGDNFSRIDIYKKENLVMTRGIKTGITSMTEEIAEAMEGKTGKAYAGIEGAKKILMSLLNPDMLPLKETDAGFDLKEEEKFQMIVPVLERLNNQIERTFKHYTSTTGNQKVEKLFVSLGMNIYDPILNYIGDQLGTKAEYFDPLNQYDQNAATKSIKLSERMALIPALGLSLSNNIRTPNAIFNYKEKAREKNIRKINGGILAAFAALFIVCVAFMFLQYVESKKLNTNLKELNSKLSLTDPRLSTENMSALKKEVEDQKPLLHQYAQRHQGLATISEIIGITPDGIYLTSLKISKGSYNPPEGKPDGTAEENNGYVILEGVASGDSNTPESFLDQYVKLLENSPMLSQVAVQKRDAMTIKKAERLYFTLSAKIG